MHRCDPGIAQLISDDRKYTYTKPTFQEVASILRASTALSFEKFKPWARQYLENMWSPNLDSVTTTCIPLATETIILARRCSIPSVLKRALYELVRMKGFGQIHVIHDDNDDSKSAGTLSATDHLILTKAREKLGSRWIEIALSPPRVLRPAASVPTPRPLCDNAHCTFASPENTHRIYRKLVHDSGIFASYIWDTICGVQALLDAPWTDEGCCVGCVGKIKGEWQRQKERIWRDLDVWFGLSGTV
ncbi:hypothetical protein BDZ94DRAFT_1263029 [Collybia nuda]|uniref:Uncharacterized protein n=1 Tax=Collybia nuda TaxID=64659 RepID=A0A9P5Y3X6_9AGAR|nr:hypothetical protein BDZ94DRAFT_1263029 [Collybia nuda]